MWLSYVTFDVTVLGTKGCLRLHDFALPFEESLGHGKFLEASELDYGKIEPGMWCPKPNEHVVETGFSQDALMVKEFADWVCLICWSLCFVVVGFFTPQRPRR